MQIGPKKVLLTVVITVALAGFGPTRAQACSCGAPPPPLERVAAMAAVFEGYVLDKALAPGGGALVVHYQVLRAWKGVHADTVATITTGTSDGDCGIPAELHTAYLVYAGMFQGQLTANSCFLSHRSDQDTGDFAAIGTPMEVGTAAPGSLSSAAAPGGGCAIVSARPGAALGGWWVGLAAIGLAFRRKRQP
jgi:MYXO-CTERM domain-containing protein